MAFQGNTRSRFRPTPYVHRCCVKQIHTMSYCIINKLINSILIDFLTAAISLLRTGQRIQP